MAKDTDKELVRRTIDAGVDRMFGLSKSVLSRPGRVVQCGDGEVTVVVEASCGTCASPCLGGLMHSEAIQVRVANLEPRKVGLQVDLVLQRKALAKACGLVFGLPLVGLLVGGLIGEATSSAEGGALLGVGCAVAAVLSQREALRSRIKIDIAPRWTAGPARRLGEP